MNTFREYRRQKIRRAFSFLLAGVFGICFASFSVFALDPNRMMSQYSHDFWGVEKGFSGGTVYAIAQTPDGYLWLGCEKGLIRFDGLRFELFQPDEKGSSESEAVIALATDAEGSLWIRLRSPKVFRYRGRRFEDVFTNLREGNYQITAMSRGKNGDVLVSKLERGLFRYGGDNFSNILERVGLPQSVIISLAETETGEIWMGTREAGLFRLEGQKRTTQITDGLPDRKINCLLPDGNQLWIGTDNGIARWNATGIVAPDLSAELKNSRVLKILKDNQSNVWLATQANGLVRLNQNGEASSKNLEFPSSKTVTAIFEDREANLWVGTPEGIERLRDNAFMSYASAQGLPFDAGGGAIYVDSETRTWFAPAGGGLYWLEGNRIESVKDDRLDKDVVYSIAGGSGKDDLWLGRQRGGLTHLYFNGSSYAAETFKQSDGLAQSSVFTVYQSRDGSVWAGTLSGGASRFKDGKFTTFTTADGLASNSITAIAETADGTMWFATPNGLSSLTNERWQTYSTKNGLPSEKINSLLADANGVLWIGTAKGLARFDSGQIHFNADVPASLRESIFGIAADETGSLWIAAANHVLRADSEKLRRGASLGGEDFREFNVSDGLVSAEGVKRSRSVTADSLGRIWFSLSRGISVVDPKRLKNNSISALVHIGQISADGAAIDSQNPARIPAGSRRIVFDFAGLCLSAPERVRFRYKLDDFDKDWSEVTDASEAIYTNLAPGSYRFWVMASNGDDAWNSDEATTQIIVAPMYWQTWWFRILTSIAALLVLFSLYRFNLRRLTRQLNFRFAERLAERTRIAQELHDTLLQGVFSASIQLDSVVEQLPDDSPVKPRLSRVRELTGQIMTEGRNTVRGLHSPNSENSLVLEQAFSGIKQDLDIREQIDFRVVVDGTSRPLRPIVRDEIYRIGREALINAFRHSTADLIEVQIEYGAKFFRLTVRDNGTGVNEEILRKGRKGHLGLSGMREAAERIGAKLKIWSRSEGGTEVELTVPQHVVFEKYTSDVWFKRLKRFKSRRNEMPFTGEEQKQ